MIERNGYEDKNEKNRGKKDESSDGTNVSVLTRETAGILLLLISFVVLLMMVTGDIIFAGVGRAICTFMYGMFGYGSYLLVAAVVYTGVWLAFNKKIRLS